jgi:hypothetical protein
MALWKPDPNTIGKSEYIGRRLFEQPQLVGATDQKPFHGLEMSHFEEKRGDEFSVDRLGRSSVDRAVTRFLQPLATATGQSFHKPKSFDGWVAIPNQKATKPAKPSVPALPLIPSPEKGNDYHAHLVTTQITANNPSGYYFAALHLREIFTGPGSQIHPANPGSDVENDAEQSFPRRIWQATFRTLPFLSKLFGKHSSRDD